MSAIDLRSFCANRFEIRLAMQFPWQEGDWVYATNGHMAVRVPSVAAPGHVERTAFHPKKAAELFAKAWDHNGEFIAIPRLPNALPCSVCGGKGSVFEHELSEDEECIHCFGLGKDWQPMPCGDSSFNLLYLLQFASLPSVRIRTHGMTEAALLTFDGGEGLLMPMKDKSADTGSAA